MNAIGRLSEARKNLAQAEDEMTATRTIGDSELTISPMKNGISLYRLTHHQGSDSQEGFALREEEVRWVIQQLTRIIED